MTTRRPLRQILARAWLIPALTASGLSIVGFLALGWFNYQNALNRLESDLDHQSLTVARRLAAEVLMGIRGSPETVASALRQDLGLRKIEVTKDTGSCESLLKVRETCISRSRGHLDLLRRLPMVLDPTYVRVTTPAPTFLDSLNPWVLVWSGLPILLIAAMGMWAFSRILKKYVLDPVEDVTSSVSSGDIIPDYWPEELARLSSDLQDAFTKRDQALVGQMASGVIHDLKTLLHSAWSSALLADEAPQGSEKRQARLESFLKAAKINFPKMEALIQTTLDGSRDIAIQTEAKDLQTTLQQAVRSTQDLAQRSGVQVEVGTSTSFVMNHDALQMERALTNLIKNAIEAAAESSGRVAVAAHPQADGGVMLRIEDSGPGLGENPSQVLTSVRSTKTHGTGLGLVISKKIIEAHSGTLQAKRSAALGGACFDVVLPQRGGARHESHSAPKDSRPRR